jgi:hypothetical protein
MINSIVYIKALILYMIIMYCKLTLWHISSYCDFICIHVTVCMLVFFFYYEGSNQTTIKGLVVLISLLFIVKSQISIF